MHEFEYILWGMAGVVLLSLGIYWFLNPQKAFPEGEEVHEKPMKIWSAILMVNGGNIIFSAICFFLIPINSSLLLLLFIVIGMFLSWSAFFYIYPNTIWLSAGRFSRRKYQPGYGTATIFLGFGIFFLVLNLIFVF
ncbi:MAG: hypothetical protein HWN65_06970 [Candidatus Helarchaeota archaeon]|nr:hypothetical protein [Candidatus Helarchaeota archaeon]